MISQEHRSPSDTRKALVPVTSNNNVYTKVHRSRHCTVGPPRRCRPRKCIVANGRQPAPVASLTFHTRTIEITIFKVLYVQHTSVLKCSLTSRWSQCLLDLEPESNTGHKSFPRFTIMLYRFAVTKSDLPPVSYDFMEDLRSKHGPRFSQPFTKIALSLPCFSFFLSFFVMDEWSVDGIIDRTLHIAYVWGNRWKRRSNFMAWICTKRIKIRLVNGKGKSIAW